MGTTSGSAHHMHACRVEGERFVLLPSINKAMRKAVAEWEWAVLLEADPRRPAVVMPELNWEEFRQAATALYPRWEILEWNGDQVTNRPPWVRAAQAQRDAQMRDG